MHIVVIGAGSIGSHTAYRLAQQGAQVTVLEAGEPGRGTSSATMAWLSTFPQLGWEEEPGRAALRTKVHQYFYDIESELDLKVVDWCGTLNIAHGNEAQELKHRAQIARSKGAGVIELDAAGAAEVEPLVRLGPGDTAFYQQESGWVDVAALINRLLTRAQQLGARLLTQTSVTAIERDGTGVTAVHTSTGELLEADAVVNCAGSWGTHVAAMAGLTMPLDLRPGRILTTEPLPAESRPTTIVNAPLTSVRPHPGGSLVLNGRGLQGAGENTNLSDTAPLIADIARYVPALAEVPIAETRIGIRPVPPGGPIVGALPWAPNFYFAVSHGGIGWAPMWAWFAARELLHGESVPELSAMRPERFHWKPEEIGRFADDAEQARR
ncbi:NAD(P)/FAD-dependent oxidoreductase [Nesterenkonia alkaliphila]|uniref:FAD-dependent oxidoreductase n=1 Tax=Nesterenkonia alkaliphila TaxID=1463631 RepID=A0A7K1UMQ6_9MICC|nr:FAD-dependent oxidoreductase [Nesterenkonia alkaliphila]MVT27724.1 FAD-dependent oxidoreductase [Nesterenkonia alkaliphila]GFZ87652.1 FAD-dependent oxidoreductase [Nesterenkonia alkaliphila]